MKQKKGMLGLDNVKDVLVFMLILAVIAIAMFLALTSIINSSTSLKYQTSAAQSRFVNKTITLNTTGGVPSPVAGYDNVVLSGVELYNITDGSYVTSGNYTVSGPIIAAAAGSLYTDTDVNVTVNSWTYRAQGKGSLVTNNVTGGVTGFFSNATTIFTILGAVIIILAVSLILYAVNRFGVGSTTTQGL